MKIKAYQIGKYSKQNQGKPSQEKSILSIQLT